MDRVLPTVTPSTTVTDGFGQRLTGVDSETGEQVELLELAPELVEHTGFVTALAERVARLASVRHTSYVHLRRLDRPSPDRLQLLSDLTPGWRLSDLLEESSAANVPVDISAVIAILRQLLPAVALFSRHNRENAIGTLAPHRLIVTPQARLVIAEHAFGSAIDKLNLGRDKLWREFRVAMPPTAGLPRANPRADANGIGIVALSLLLGRPLQVTEFPSELETLVENAQEHRDGQPSPISTPFKNWLKRTLQFDAANGFQSPAEAQLAFESVLASDRSYVTTSPALAHWVSDIGGAIDIKRRPAPPPLEPEPEPETEPSPEPVPVFLRSMGEVAAPSTSAPDVVSISEPAPEPETVAEVPEAIEEVPVQLEDDPVAHALLTYQPAEDSPPADASPAAEPVSEPEPEPISEPEPEPVAEAVPVPAVEPLEEPTATIEVIDEEEQVVEEAIEVVDEGDEQEPAPIAEAEEEPQPVAAQEASTEPARDEEHVAPATDAYQQQELDQEHSEGHEYAEEQEHAAEQGYEQETDWEPAAMPAAYEAPSFESDAMAVAGEAPMAAAAPYGEPSSKSPFSNPIVLGLAGMVVVLIALMGWLLMRDSSGGMREGEGELVVQSRPEGAQVKIDGQARGTTPLTLRLGAGAHVMEVQSGQSEPRVIPLMITAGVQTSQYVELRGVATTGGLEIRSEPAGARITIDGRPRGTTPATITDLTPGDHTVVLESGGRKVTQAVKIEAGITAQLVVPLRR